MTPFRPLGKTARWRMLYDELLLPAAIGDLITYEEMGNVLDLHPTKQRAAIRSALRRAEREYLEEKGHALEAVADSGYQVAEASAHIVLAHRQQRKAGRALSRGHELATRVDLSGVDPQIRNALDLIARGFAAQMEFNRRFDVRQRDLEEAMATISKQHERTADEVEQLRERLRRVEDRLDE